MTAYEEFTKMRKCIKEFAEINQQLVTDGMTRFQYVSSCYIGPRVYPLGSLVIALVRLSVRLSVFRCLGDRSVVFSENLHEFRGQLSKKSDTAKILKKNLNPGIKGD